MTGSPLRVAFVAVAIVAACGGKSVRTIEEPGDDDASVGGDPNPRGGGPGSGGTGVDPAGGRFSGGTFSGGTFGGGTTGRGGASSGGVAPFGGTGTGAVGQGGAPSLCADQPGLPPRVEGVSWDWQGVISWDGNSFGNQGAWYSADDCGAAASLNLRCTGRNAALAGPDGQIGWTTNDLEVCADGVAPQVGLLPDGTYAYAEQWGFLLGFTLNGGKPWNAAERCVFGVEFEVSGFAPAVLRINLPTTTTQGIAHFAEVKVPGHVELPFGFFSQGSWVARPTALDTTQLTSLEFHVFTNTVSPTRFSYCISDVRWMY